MNVSSSASIAKEVKPILSKQEITDKNLDLNDLAVIDSFALSKTNYTAGLLKGAFFTAIAILIFFVPVNVNGKTDMVFGIFYNFFVQSLGDFGLWLITLLVVATGILSVYGKYIAKSGLINQYFKEDSIIHPILYLLGAFFTLAYTLNKTTPIKFPELIVGPATGGTIISGIVVAVFWIIVVSGVCMPFLLNYGFIDLIGSLMEPLMRPVWKVPGRAAVNAIASFVSSSSVGVLITSKLYRKGVYTIKEAVLVVTGFSAVSVGFAYMVIQTAGLEDRFLVVYFSSLLLTMVISAFIARIPPFNKKKDVYIDGRVQTEEDRKTTTNPGENIFKTGIDRMAKKAYTANPLPSEIVSSLKDGMEVIPKVLSLLAAVGTSSLIIAEKTPFFKYLGKIFEPLLHLLRVPNVQEIAPSFPVGIAEMFLPVLLIKNNIDMIHPGARYIVVAVSIVQIIFFSETIVVMMATKLPLKLWELVVVFFERTFLGIIFAAVFARVLGFM